MKSSGIAGKSDSLNDQRLKGSESEDLLGNADEVVLLPIRWLWNYLVGGC